MNKRNKLWWLHTRFAVDDAAAAAAAAGDGEGDPGGDDAAAAAAAAGGGGAGDPGDDAAAAAANDRWYPDDWHARLAKELTTEESEQKKLLPRLSRYATPKDLARGFVDSQDKIRSGQLKEPLKSDATPEELAAWRKDNGIPEKPDGYDLSKFDSGLVIGEEDKPFVDGFLEYAHTKNYTPEQVKTAVEWHFNQQEAQIAAREEKDIQESVAVTDELNQEWGGNFRKYVNAIESTIFSKIPEDIREEFRSARLPDGTCLFNNPGIVKAFAAMALEINPATTLVPQGGGDPMLGINEELEKIKGVMKSDRATYDKDEKMQARYRELLEAKQKLEARGGA